MKGKYDDIIHLPHHVSRKHPQMSAMDRAAQFSPFSALTGLGAQMDETARLTIERLELDEYAKESLNETLHQIAERKGNVTITYFVPDERKEGGAYLTVRSPLRRIDPVYHTLTLETGETIPLADVLEIRTDE
jgi:hypothetical protein